MLAMDIWGQEESQNTWLSIKHKRSLINSFSANNLGYQRLIRFKLLAIWTIQDFREYNSRVQWTNTKQPNLDSKSTACSVKIDPIDKTYAYKSTIYSNTERYLDIFKDYKGVDRLNIFNRWG